MLNQYEARIPPRSTSFVWPSDSILLRIQGDLDRDLFQHCEFEASRRYRKLFLRELCAKLDAAVQAECAVFRTQGIDEIEYPEMDAALLERYVDEMASGSSSDVVSTSGPAPDTEFTTHYWPRLIDTSTNAAEATGNELLRDFAKVTIREEGSAISKGTTGLRTWEAGLRLAGHLVSEPSLITAPGTRILELGSGAGFVGSVCAIQQTLSQIAKVNTYMTDMPGQVVARIWDTLRLNGLDSSSSIVQVKELDWLELSAERQQSQQRDDLPSIKLLGEVKPSLILAADVVYDPDLIPPLVEAIRACLEAGTSTCRALVASTIRNADTYGAFKASLGEFASNKAPFDRRYRGVLCSKTAFADTLPHYALKLMHYCRHFRAEFSRSRVGEADAPSPRTSVGT